MKVKLKYGISTYSGTIDEITFSSYRNGTICIARKWVMPRLTDQNGRLGEIAQNLSELYGEISAGFKADLKRYAELYGQQKADKTKLIPSAYAQFMKLMYAFAEGNGGSIDLSSITYNDIQTLFADIADMKTAIESGYLPDVKGSDELTEAI